MNKTIGIVVAIVVIAGVGIFYAMNNQGAPSGETNSQSTAPASSPDVAMPAPETPASPSAPAAQTPATKPPTPAPKQSPSAPAPTPTPPAQQPSAPALVSHALTIQGFAFSQSSITVKKGDTVVWTNKESAPHTVTGDGGLASPTLNTNGTYSFTFNTAGTFAYHCAFHPSMKGTVVVQ